MADARAGVLADFIRTNLLADKRRSLAPDDALFGEGLVDSMGAVLLAAFVEERFGVTLDDGELRSGELETIADILASIDRQR